MLAPHVRPAGATSLRNGRLRDSGNDVSVKRNGLTCKLKADGTDLPIPPNDFTFRTLAGS